ncbi:BCCT family transporter [Jannaschia pohangensis]|uniref:Choline/carnitine/betaine transport n=1 Tax=Jannaschia pohangensis TaxID=390807 RepID=A0A1I3M923_9RHOB|nr:BCCT family transporter [Jannaschia pohangensis]SFI93447.1 choline/carnitine/betaine transport [Jannaschia pohangensis]
MSKDIDPPLTQLSIKTSEGGFYNGFATSVAVPGKIIISSLCVWAIFWPIQSGAVLNGMNSFILQNFAAWYVWVVAFFVAVCLGLAIWPTGGRMNLGLEGEKPEFGNFSWFSMMFGAGIGVGMLTWSVAEPVYHFQNNPDVIKGLATASGADNVMNAYKWSYLHWGLAAWACYAVAGLCLAFFTYRRGLPLTIRSALTPLFGRHLSGVLGHIIDIVAVIATILGVAQTLGFGVAQFAAGLTRIGIGGLTDAEGAVTTFGIITALLVIMGASTLSALSGVGKGIKWLSNINMGLSIILLTFFILFGATFFGFQAMTVGLFDYLVATPAMLVTVWGNDGVEGSVAAQLAGWQGSWTVFYWAWWIAFAPFVGLFLARISRGRTIREFVLGAMIVPALMCFVWFAWAGGTAIDLELNGTANGSIFGAPDGDKIFAMTTLMLQPISEILSWGMSLLIVVLLMTFLVTSADSAVLIVNTINAAGDEGPKARPHILFWGVALGVVVAGLLVSGGTSAIQTAMVIGALPFSAVMVLMCISLLKAIWNDGRRQRAGVATTHDKIEGASAPVLGAGIPAE